MIDLKVAYKYRNQRGMGVVIDADNNLKWFNSTVLGIGDLTEPANPVDVLAVILDLEGFTTFTRQVDPRLTIPNFVSDFFNWLFESIKAGLLLPKKANTLWAELPFFCKFLGDGVLLLWKFESEKVAEINKQLNSGQLTDLTQELICNIVGTLYEICESYKLFIAERQFSYVDAPTRLRCGIARGDAFPLGGGKDYVGACINIASRLQKFSDLSFAVCARGIDNKYFNPGWEKYFVKKRVAIRGIGDNEIILVRADEFKKLDPKSKKLFK